jgi:hypothetical protein
MSGVSACPIVLSASVRHRLKRLTRTASAEHRQVVRATIVLLAAGGLPNSGIAERVVFHPAALLCGTGCIAG